MGKDSTKGKDWGDRGWGKDSGKSKGGDKGKYGGGKGQDSSFQCLQHSCDQGQCNF